MDIGVTISKVRKEYREYLRETHPDWADTTISTHVSDAFYLYQNTIALSFWKCFESDASMEKAKGEIFDYLKQEVMSDRADERTAQYYRDLKRLKEFIDSKGGVKTYIGYEYDCEVIVYKYAMTRWWRTSKFSLKPSMRQSWIRLSPIKSGSVSSTSCSESLFSRAQKS